MTVDGVRDAAFDRREDLRREIEARGRTARRMSSGDIAAIMSAADAYAAECQMQELRERCGCIANGLRMRYDADKRIWWAPARGELPCQG